MSTRVSRSDSSAFAPWTWSDAGREAVKKETVIGSDLFHKTQRSLQQDTDYTVRDRNNRWNEKCLLI